MCCTAFFKLLFDPLTYSPLLFCFSLLLEWILFWYSCAMGRDLGAGDEGRRDLQPQSSSENRLRKGDREDVEYIHDRTAPTRKIAESSSCGDAEEAGRTEIHQHGRYCASNARRRRGVVNSPPFNELEICVCGLDGFPHTRPWALLSSWKKRQSGKRQTTRQDSGFGSSRLHPAISDSCIRQCL